MGTKGKEQRKVKKVIEKENHIMDNEKKKIIHDEKNLHKKKMPQMSKN